MRTLALPRRFLRVAAIVAIVATPIVVITAGPAAAATAGDQDALYDAFTDGGVTQIDLTANIVIDSSGFNGCDQMTRSNGADALVIDGHGHSITKAAECEGERIFRSYASNPITFQNVTVSGGVKEGNGGGALKADGPVNVVNSTFSHNQALECELKNGVSSTSDPEAGTASYCNQPYGGAILAEGSVHITGSTFDSNHADGAGGGVFSYSDVTVTGSTFSNNSATSNWCWCSGGGFLALGGADVASSNLTDNSAGCEIGCDGSGGGFWAKGAAQVVGSTLSGNQAGCGFGCQGLGGGFYASGFSHNSFAQDATTQLGAAGADPGNVVVSGSTFSGNVATCGFDIEAIDSEGHHSDTCGSGGGFSAYHADSVSVTQSTFNGNQAVCTFSEPVDLTSQGSDPSICGIGGGFFTRRSDTVDVNASTFAQNTATFGGGAIWNGAEFFNEAVCEGCGGSSDMTVVNSTVTANTSGIFGAITSLDENDTVTLTNNTIVGNALDISALEEASATAEESTLGANLTVANLTSFGTIVTGGFGKGVLAGHVGNCLIENVTSQGYNFTDDTTCDFTDPTDIVHTPNDPKLQTLGAYGGPTNTMRPLGEIQSGVVTTLSPVVDQIPAAKCKVSVDQRGVSRPQTVVTNACDIGSVEITAAEITVASEVVVVTPHLTG